MDTEASWQNRFAQSLGQWSLSDLFRMEDQYSVQMPPSVAAAKVAAIESEIRTRYQLGATSFPGRNT